MTELFTLFGTGSAGDPPVTERVAALLGSTDRQERLAAYAYVYANPESGSISELVDAVTTEATRLGQYWGVRALRRQVLARPTELDADGRDRLQRFASEVGPDTDAAEELWQLLAGPAGGM